MLETDLKAPLSKPQRPVTVTLLALGVLTIASLNLVRLYLAISQWKFLAELPAASPLYLVLTALVWNAAGWPLVWGLWKGKSWAPSRCRTFTLAYAVYFWLERLFLFGRPHGSTGLPSLASLPGYGIFSAVITVLLVAFVFWTLSRKPVKGFFTKLE